MGACKRVIQLGVNSGIKLIRLRGINAARDSTVTGISIHSFSSLSSSSPPGYQFDYRQISQLVKPKGKRVRSLEAKGIPSNHAEAITLAMTEVLDDCMENISQSLISKAEMQKIKMAQEANLSKFQSEVQGSKERHFSLLQREAEKLMNDIEKMRGELRYEIDKVTAGQRLDLNLERGRIRDELSNQSAETTHLTNKLDGEIHALRAHIEAAKNDVIKYCIGTLLSISAVGIGMIRVFSAK
ncbi:hypothetical protein Fot_50909 [Forsythia ovata]|uniref:Uncharacterized protein n=1 Tax=Forsythia ovata TaxID=205694 RepID=A0ABD1PZI5_9LAMI